MFTYAERLAERMKNKENMVAQQGYKKLPTNMTGYNLEYNKKMW